MRRLKHFVALGAVVAAATSCGDVVRSSKSPVLLQVQSLEALKGGPTTSQASGFLLSDVITIVTAPPPCSAQSPCATTFDDSGQATLTIVPKDITIQPTSNNYVTVNRVHIKYTRADGRNVQGVDVPYEFDGAVTVQVTGNAQVGFELVRHAAKEEPPLVNLISSGSIITTIAEVTFYGVDTVGNAVTAVGTIQVNFGNFGDSQ